jgi:hypothetical protein
VNLEFELDVLFDNFLALAVLMEEVVIFRGIRVVILLTFRLVPWVWFLCLGLHERAKRDWARCLKSQGINIGLILGVLIIEQESL